MTNEEKRQWIYEHCNKTACGQCPINDTEYAVLFCQKYTEVNAPESVIDGWHESLAGKEEPVEDTPTEHVEESTEETPTPDNVNHPSHYDTGKFECIDVMLETQGIEAVKSFCLCNAFKYLYRHCKKNGAEDVNKALWYLNKYVELENINE